jgi:hypothetical protein
MTSMGAKGAKSMGAMGAISREAMGAKSMGAIGAKSMGAKSKSPWWAIPSWPAPPVVAPLAKAGVAENAIITATMAAAASTNITRLIVEANVTLLIA